MAWSPPYAPNATPSKTPNLISSLEKRMEGCFRSPRVFQQAYVASLTQSTHFDAVTKWSLQSSKQLYSQDRCIESMDIHSSEGSRYMLTGSHNGILSIYDLSSAGAEQRYCTDLNDIPSQRGPRLTAIHKPVARSSATPSAVLKAQWYPTDTGAFISSHKAGSVCVFDTNAMAPVSRMEPFALEGFSRNGSRARQREGATHKMSLACMDLNKSGNNLVATGSLQSSLVKLLDLRTGASSHTLIGHGNASGISSVQWSPSFLSPHVLASGDTRGCIRLWDIRKAGRNAWLTELDREQPPPSLQSSRVFSPDLSHLKKRGSRSSSLSSPQSSLPLPPQSTKSPKSSSKTLHSQQRHAPNDYSPVSLLTRAHEGVVQAIAWDPTGQFLVSHAKGESSLKVWDLRDSGQAVAHRYVVSTRGRVSSKLRVTNTFGTASVSKNGSCSPTIWFAQETRLSAFDLHNGGPAKFQLSGHLKAIRDFGLVEDWARPEIYTCAADGLLLAWEPSILKPPTATDPLTRRKRQRTIPIEDQDSW